jgi:hypothetical protein
MGKRRQKKENCCGDEITKRIGLCPTCLKHKKWI